MQLVQWIHKIAKANSIMYPGYKDKLYITKLFLDTVMKQWSMVNYSELIQHEKKRKNKNSLCESEVEGV